MKMLEKITPNARVLNGFLSMLVIGLIGMLIAMAIIMILWAVGVL